MAKRKTISNELDNIRFQKILDELIKKKFDVEIDQFLKKYMNNFLRDFENQQRKNLTNNIMSTIFGENNSNNNNFSNRGMSERQVLSGVFFGLLGKIF